MDAMKEAFKRHISKHMVKGKPIADNAEDPTHKFGKDDGELADNDPDKMKSDHAPMLHDGDAIIEDSMVMEDPMHEASEEDLLMKIRKALMGAGDHMGRGAMSLNEHAKDAMLSRKKV